MTVSRDVFSDFTALMAELVERVERLEQWRDVQTTATATAASPFVTRAEAADLLHVSVGTVDRYLRRGRLRSEHLGARVLLDREEVLALVLANKGESVNAKPQRTAP